MEKSVITKLTKSFEELVHNEDGVEYWMAREIQTLLEYSKWDNFLNVIEKAKIACETSSYIVSDHFADCGKMKTIGRGNERETQDFKLTRLACYLIALNGNPKKEAIAFAQSYFALQTRKQELLEERIKNIERLHAREKLSQTEKELSCVLYEHGVDTTGFAIIRSQGDHALFGGHCTKSMKKRLGVPGSRALADFLPAITIKAKDFAAEITHFNVKKEDLQGQSEICDEHVKNNKDVRELLVKKDIYPEKLPPEEDIKKVQRKIEKENKKIASSCSSLSEPSLQL